MYKRQIGYCSDYKAGMDAGRKIAEAEYHNWELTLLFGKNAYKRDDYFWDTDLQEIYDQARNASNNKDAFSAGFTAGQTMFTIEILSLIVGALESGGSSSGGQQVVLPGVGEVTIPGDAAGSVAGVLPPGSILSLIHILNQRIPLPEAGKCLKTVVFGEISFGSWHKFF